VAGGTSRGSSASHGLDKAEETTAGGDQQAETSQEGVALTGQVPLRHHILLEATDAALVILLNSHDSDLGIDERGHQGAEHRDLVVDVLEGDDHPGFLTH
jgi:hypothetical protein